MIAITSAETYRALQERTAALAQRNTEYGERIEHQSATIDVLKAMSASPGDPQPVFDLIVDRARDLCDAYGATVFEFDGTGIHWRAATGVSDDPAVRAAYEAQFPMVPTRGWAFGRAILDRRIIRIDDMEAEPGLDPTLRGITAKSNVTTPIMRGDEVIGAIGMGSREKGGFSDSQVELLKTFAEQAAIAITSAETYRALQTRTSDLQETLEYQTATSDVLKVISRSTFDLQPVLDTVVETAARLCDADRPQSTAARAKLRLAANFRVPSGIRGYVKATGAMRTRPWLAERQRRAVARRPRRAYSRCGRRSGLSGGRPISLGKQRTSLGVPLLREGEAIGCIVLARQRVEPFTDRQIELVSTFADQAVIAIENTRLMTEQREALEQQTATAEVLQVINASPGNLAPVFDAMLREGDAAVRGGVRHSVHLRWREVSHGCATRGLSAARYRRCWREPVQPRRRSTDRLISGRTSGAYSRSGGTEAYRRRQSERRAMVELGGATHRLSGSRCARTSVCSGLSCVYRQEVQAVLRQADRPAGELRRPGGDRDGERAAADRAAGGAGAADRDRRGVAGDQRLARQSDAGVRCDAGKGDAAVRGAFGHLVPYDGERFRAAARHAACPTPMPSMLAAGDTPTGPWPQQLGQLIREATPRSDRGYDHDLRDGHSMARAARWTRRLSHSAVRSAAQGRRRCSAC